MYSEPVVLNGRHVRLQPMLPEHAEGLFEAMRGDEELWRYLPTAIPGNLSEMQGWVCERLELHQRGENLPFTVFDLASGSIVGSTSFSTISEENRNAEIGWTWYARPYQRTGVNTDCKYLLLGHAFEALGCIRVYLKTDLRNERSQRAIERIGGVREGVLRRDRVIKDGYQRSSVYYSILDDEWPGVRARLEEMLRR